MARIRSTFERVSDQAFADFQRRPRVPVPFEGADHTGMPADLATAETNALRRISPRRSRWPELNELEQQIGTLEQRKAETGERLRELRLALANAPQRDADLLAEWEIGGRKGPRPQASIDQLERDIAEGQAEIAGLDTAVTRILREKAEFVEKHRARLVRDADKATNEAHERVLQLIGELEQARATLVELREAAVWASLFPGEATARGPRMNLLAGGLARPVRDTLGLDAAFEYPRVIAALRADADWAKRAATSEQRVAMGDVAARPGLETQATWTGTEEGREAERAERKAQRERYAAVWGSPPSEFGG